jgi:muramoyltetrapeptide carboxypeptidase LdcA involved in peptidoglycan recycling
MSTRSPPKLKKGDKVRIVAPARSLSLSWVKQAIDVASKRLKSLGLVVSFGANSFEMDEFGSSSVQRRVNDLNDAFSDPEVKLVLSAIGGYNSNQLLDYIDYDTIARNPKIMCGNSDVTSVLNAISIRSRVITYYGPHFFNFGEIQGFEYTQRMFRNCLFRSGPFSVMPSRKWSDDKWTNQLKREFVPSSGHWSMSYGAADSQIAGGNLITLNMLQGTKYFPPLSNKIVFLEEAREANPQVFDRNLEALTMQEGFHRIKGLVIGRFQKRSLMTRAKLARIIESKRELDSIPIVANVDFGHTSPKLTIPIGGTARLMCENNLCSLQIVRH